MTPEDFIQLLNRQQWEIANCINRTLPVKVGVLARNHFQDNFLKGGFVNNGLQKWKPAKRLLSGKSGADNKYRTLMSGREHLFREIRYVPGVARVVVQNKAPYAAVHNEGLRAGRGRGFQMPKRQFMGKSKELDEKVGKTIDTELGKIIKR